MVKENTGIVRNIWFWDKIFLWLSFTTLFLFSRKDIYWQSAAAFGASFFVLLGLAFFLFKNKNKFTLSGPAILGIIATTFFYLLSQKYNIFAYVDYVKIVSSFLVFLYASLLIKKYGNSFLDSFLKFLVHLLFFVSVFSLFFYFLYSKDPSIFAWVSWPIISKGIVMGTWGYSNTFAIFMVLGIFVTQYFSIKNMELENLSLKGKGFRIFLNRHFYDILTAFFIPILFLTTSRFSMFIFAGLWFFYIVLLMFLKKQYKKIIIFKILLIFVLSSTILFVLIKNNAYLLEFSQQKMLSLFDTLIGRKVEYSGATRFYLIKFSLQQFSENKFLGEGLGSFKFLLRQYIQGVDFEKLIDPHALFAKILVETGFLGFLTIFIPMGYLLFKKVVFAFKNKSNSNEFIIILGMVAIFVHMNVDMDFVFPVTLVSLMAILALLGGEGLAFNLSNRKLINILGIALLIFSIVILPKFISSSLLLKKDMDSINYNPKKLTVASSLYPENLYLNETIAENISNRILWGEESLVSLEKALGFYSKYSFGIKVDYLPHLNSGILLFKLGEEKAVEQFRKAILLAPMTPETNGWYSFSRSIFYKNISKENIEYGQKSVDIAGWSYSGHLFFANYFRLVGQKTEMLKELKYLEVNYPEEGIPYFIEYLYYESLKDMGKMDSLLIKAEKRGFDILRFKKGLN